MLSTKNFKKWAKDKPPLLAMLAHSQVQMSKIAYVLVKEVHENDMMFGKDVVPDLDSWLKLFRTHQNINTYVWQLFQFPTGSFNNLKSLPENFKKSGYDLDNLKLESEEKILEEYLNSYNISEEEFEKENPMEQFENHFNFTEFYFFLRVQVPCAILCFTAPAQLLRSARQRDFKSLLKLVKIDPSAIFDRKIARYIHELRLTNSAKFEQVHDALKRPLDKIPLKKFKVLYAAMITQISIEFNHRLNEPDIRSLFDAIAQDCGQGLVDPDIPESPHAFYMAIKRLVPSTT